MSEEKLLPKLRFEEFQNDKGWSEFKLGELANIVRGASPRPIQNPKWFDVKSKVGWLRISDVTKQNGRINYLEQRISKAGQEKTRVLKKPHLLISIAATVGKPVINYVETGVHDGFLIFKEPSFEKEFMYQWLEMFRKNWFKYGQPGSQVNLNSTLVKNQSINLPSRHEQEKISSFFKKLDAMIQLQQSKLDKVKDIKSAYLSEMFPKEGEKYPKKRFEEFSGKWESVSLKNIINITTGSLDANESTPFGKYPFFTTSEKPLKIDKFAFTGPAITLPGNGVMGNSRYIPSGVKFNAYQRVYVLTHLENNNHYSFINDSISKYLPAEINRRASGSVISYITKDVLENLTIKLPTLKEQKKIAKFFKNLDTQISLEEEKLDKLEKLKQAYLNDMFV